MKLKVTISIPEQMIKDIVERKSIISKECGDVCENDIIRDELDIFTQEDNGSFLKEVIPQIKELVEYKTCKQYYDELATRVERAIPKCGRGKRIHHGRHKKS